MSVTGIIIVFALSWWIILFMLLPMGVEVPHVHEEGHAQSAPSDPKLGAKIVGTTLLSCLFTLAVHYCFIHGIFVWPQVEPVH